MQLLLFWSTYGRFLKGHADQGSMQPCSMCQKHSIKEDINKQQITQFDNVGKLFNVHLNISGLFEQLSKVMWCALKILILLSFMVLPVKGISRIPLSGIAQMWWGTCYRGELTCSCLSGTSWEDHWIPMVSTLPSQHCFLWWKWEIAPCQTGPSVPFDSTGFFCQMLKITSKLTLAVKG